MPPKRAQRALRTVLITDIVGSTTRAADLGDRRWTQLLERHNNAAREQLRRFGGEEIRTTGDGFLATFDGPAASIGAALGIIERSRSFGLEIRAGVHTGECERRGQELSGIAVHVAKRIADLAADGEVLVSSTVKDLATGADLDFTARGTRTLKGVPGRWKVFAATVSRPHPRRQSSADAVGAKLTQREPPAPLPRVLLVDDHPHWRESLAALVDRRHAGIVAGQAGGAREAIELAAELRPDVVVMDVALPDESGIAATRRIKADHPSIRVVMLSSSDEREQVLDGVRAGADGYLVKTAKSDEILDAIRRVHAGEAVFPPTLAAIVLDEVRHPAAPDPETKLGSAPLTERELAVLELMAAGRSNQAIGDQLHLSQRTVESHVTSIFTKLDLQPTLDDHRRVLAVLAYLRQRT